jgi:hypothetical protein
MLIYSPLSAYFDVIPQQPALSNDGKQRQPALGDFTCTSPIVVPISALAAQGLMCKGPLSVSHFAS